MSVLPTTEQNSSKEILPSSSRSANRMVLSTICCSCVSFSKVNAITSSSIVCVRLPLPPAFAGYLRHLTNYATMRKAKRSLDSLSPFTLNWDTPWMNSLKSTCNPTAPNSARALAAPQHCLCLL
ncbi:hypothetical protein MSG28_004873 [Choristoneura fumiferana]|uniref:Uncharacterized protein n=1 Tax=Choristoneura fumiferana TaxID=7141 RepID=A0ACC0K7T3_CHOFU|nr:hypothetical protein MSG28_004873 [Choristoneura fumiferana]